MENSEVRTQLAMYLNSFIDQGCWYSDQEREAMQNAINNLQPVNAHCEAINARHPDHGKKGEDYLW